MSMFYDVPLDDPSPEDTDSDWEKLDHQFDVPSTPSSTAGDDAPQSRSYHNDAVDSGSDREYDPRSEMVPRTKPGGYDSRIEQILYENPELPILITDAGKSLESGGRYIVYTIRTGVRSLRPGLELQTDGSRISKSADGIPSSLP